MNAHPLLAPQLPEEEADLVHGLRAGDPEAVALFLERSHRAVFALACRLCPDPEQRRDWTHDVLLRLVHELRSGRFVYRRPGCLWAWFRQRAYFLLLNCHDRNRRLLGHERREGYDAGLAELSAGAGSSPEQDLEQARIRQALEAALERLPSAEQKRALWLLLDQELSYEEIALAMGAPLNTVRSWIRRGRSAMRRDLAEKFGPPQ